MPKPYAKIYPRESVTCFYCHGTTEMLTPINNSNTFIVSKCTYCINGLMIIQREDDIPIDLDKVSDEDTR